MFKRILIANRGEIACRIARSCQALGVEYVAVHSSADRHAPHLRGAAAAVCLGEGPAAESYLRGDAVIAAALAHGCEAVHPGYGFLSENAGFAQAVQDAGLVFIGPRPDTIAALGDKSRAKALMQAAGVPTVPGLVEASDDPAVIEAMVGEVGLPILLKPSAGGGGKGMQVLSSLDAMRPAIEAAIRVARSSFGDGRLIVERFIERPRHIEVQVFGDRQGQVVHLFERECSLQRRHQKVVEEAPAAHLPDDVRQRLLEAAVRGARSIGYLNAGTFEFIVSQDHDFYFLEVNTRLQVEHPVTEAITGIDLVAWQLRVAAGEALPLSQADIQARGHAIECRVYAEDPSLDFRPTPGRVAALAWPAHARVDAGVEAGGTVPPFYDPMIAKLVTRADDRAGAIARMRAALSETVLLGLSTNLGFLSRVLDDPQVRLGQVHTRYLDDALPSLAVKPDERTALACAAAHVCGPARHDSPWAAGGLDGAHDRRCLSESAPLGCLSLWLGDQLTQAELVSLSGSRLGMRVGDADFDLTLASHGGPISSGRVNGHDWSACDAGTELALQIDGWRCSIQTLQMRRPGELAAAGAATAPMPGVLTLLPRPVGDRVEPGDVLAVVEAMKMENQVLATAAGVVSAIHFPVGAQVNTGDLLVEVDVSGDGGN